MTSDRVHHYRARCSWRGSTAVGYDRYGRAHTSTAPPAATELALTSDPAFRGDPERLNPEQLLLVAAASCQLLSFLAAAARARIDVLEYDDDAEAEMDMDDRPARITRITLRPRIVVAAGAPRDRVEHLVEVAHRECFIANSLRSEMTIEPAIAIR
ncbi:MAG: OsmC family protein [Acidimicrobiia bacterium]